MITDQEHIRVDVDADAAVAIVTLARPAKRNALTEEMMSHLAHTFDTLSARTDVEVVVLRGAGPAFCGGADRTAYPGGLSEGSWDGNRRRSLQVGERLVRAIQECSAVTIARLHGHVVGGGMVMALACDVRIASDDAALSLPETAIGLPLAWSATPLVVDEVGPLIARELLLFGRVYGAAEAQRLGMINAAVSEAEVDEVVAQYIERATSRDRAAVLATKVQFNALKRSRATGDITAFDSLLLHYSTQLETVRVAFGEEPLGHTARVQGKESE